MSESSGTPLTYILQIVGSADALRQLRQVSDHIRDLGDESEQSAAKVDNASLSITQLATEMGASANQFNSAIQGASGLYFQYDSLEKVALRVDKAERGLTTARAGLMSAQDKLNDLVDKGIKAGPQYEEAQLRLEAAQENLRIKSEELGMAQGDLTEEQLNFALSVVPASISAVSSFAGGIRTLQGSMLVARLSSINLSGAIWGTNTGLHATPVASAMAATGVRGFGLAVRTTMLSIGPLGWALMGITTALTLVSTNAFGVRDAIHAMGKAIGDAVPVLRPFLEWLGEASRALFPDAEMEAEKMGAGVSASMDEMAAGTQASTSSQDASLEELKAQFTSTKELGSREFEDLADAVHVETNRMISDAGRAKAAIEDLREASGVSPATAYVAPVVAAPVLAAASPTAAPDLRRQVQEQEALVRRLGSVPGGKSLDPLEKLVNEGKVGRQVIDEFRKLEALRAQAETRREVHEALTVSDTLHTCANRSMESLGVSDRIEATVTRPQVAIPKITVHVYVGEREVARTINLELGDMAG